MDEKAKVKVRQRILELQKEQDNLLEKSRNTGAPTAKRRNEIEVSIKELTKLLF